MSAWTHIVACYSVECRPNKIYEIMANAPKITGSEGNADVFINQRSGYNVSGNFDCEHCVYGATKVSLDSGGWNCDAPENYKCPEFKEQTMHAITVCGDLRDRI